jgi:small subunit ribosomal protein S1
MSPEDSFGSASAESPTASAASGSADQAENGAAPAQVAAQVAGELPLETQPATEELGAAVSGGVAVNASEDTTGTVSAPQAAESPADARADAFEANDMMVSMPEVSGLSPGEITRGTVVKVTDAEVMVDIGLKSEGAIAREEFLGDDGQLSVQPGDVVDVFIEEYDEQEGTFTVSHRKAAAIRSWEELEAASHGGACVRGRVLERTKGGMTVSIGGVRAFMPSSQADLRPLRNLDSLIGQEIECKVIKLNRARNNVVVSRKAAMEVDAARLKAELAGKITEGSEVTGRVKNLTGYGAFVDLGGMDGLLHVTDLAWGRVGHPSEVVKVGQELRLKVLKYDREKERISLGLKQLLPDPWERAVSNYQPGVQLTGRVVSLTDYGAFCEIEPGIEGLIHVSEMTWSRRLKHPSKFVNVGDQVAVSVLEVHPGQRRISLSLRQTLGDPWSSLAERLAPGARVEGRVRNLTDYGAFVEIEDGIEGLIHISDMSWTKNPKHPSEILKKGQKVEAVVLSVDAAQRRIALGLKQLEPDAWQSFFDETPVGSVVQGKVVRLTQFGAFVELREGIEGLCHISEMGDDYGHGGRSALKVGMELPFRVIKASREERRTGLSLKSAEPREEAPAEPRARSKAAEPAAPAASTTMGEKMEQAFRAAAVRAAARATARPVTAAVSAGAAAAEPADPAPEPSVASGAVAVTGLQAAAGGADVECAAEAGAADSSSRPADGSAGPSADGSEGEEQDARQEPLSVSAQS